MEQPSQQSTLAPLIGEWELKAAPPDEPPWPGAGRVTFEWLGERAFLIERWTVPQAFDGIAIIGPGEGPDGFRRYYLDGRGTSCVRDEPAPRRLDAVTLRIGPVPQRFGAPATRSGRPTVQAFGEIMAVLQRQHAQITGAPFGRYQAADDGGWDIEAGFPVENTPETEGRVQLTSLPGGPVARTVHVGDYGALGNAYQAVQKLADRQRLSTARRAVGVLPGRPRGGDSKDGGLLSVS